MKNRIHGVVSLILIAVAVAVAIYVVFVSSSVLAIGYLAGMTVGALAISYSFCAKCSCRHTNCSHVLPGHLTSVLPSRQQGPYHLWEYLVIALVVGFIGLFPQYFLWQHKLYLALFWGLIVAALIEIHLFVCSSCGNDKCAMCKKHG